jgi:hypothetical protein
MDEAYMQCRHAECTERETTFRFEFPDGTDAGWLCDEHAAVHGFCPGCGNFIAGSGEETSIGLCRDCFDQFAHDCADEDED